MLKKWWWSETTDQGKLDSLNNMFSALRRDSDNRKSICQDNLSIFCGFQVDNEFFLDNTVSLLDRIGIGNDYSDINSNPYNLAQLCVDSLHSKFGKLKPRPRILVSDAEWFLREKARKLQRFLDGLYSDLDVYDISRNEVLLHALIFGTGVWKTYQTQGNPQIESVFPWQILIDKRDGRKLKPRNLMEYNYISREALISKFPKLKGAILSANSASGGENIENTYDEIEIREAWHLPPAKGEKGKYACWIEKELLYCGDYSKEFFPHEFFRWKTLPGQFWGQGVVDMLLRFQNKMCDVADAIDRALVFCAPWLVNQEQSLIKIDDMSSENLLVVNYSGQIPPTIQTQNAVPPQLFQERQEVYQKSFEAIGLSEMSVASRKPGGLNSGAALKEFNDLESERFATPLTNYEEKLSVGLAKRFIAIGKDIAQNPDYKNIRVNIEGEDDFESIEWTEVDLDEDKYHLKVWSASLLGNTPAGQIDKTVELMQAGAIPQDVGTSFILDMPDLERFRNLEDSIKESIRKDVDTIYTTGERIEPQPYDNHEFGIAYANKVLHLAKQKIKNPEAQVIVTDALLNYIDLCENFITEIQAKQQEQMMQQQALMAAQQPQQPIQAVPEQQPKSEILPQV